jgi:ABC-type transporter MlaC component
LNYKKYIKLLFFVTAALIVLIAGFNWLINPYGIYESPKINGLNSNKPEFDESLYMTKSYAVRRIKPTAVCIGNSRADIAIDPEHPVWAYHPTYNLALRAAHMYEVYRYFQCACTIAPLEQVILSADFFSFNSDIDEESSFAEERLPSADNSNPFYISDHLCAMLSIHGIVSSINTIIYQQDEEKNIYLENGRRKKEYSPDPPRVRFNQNFRFYLTSKGFYSTTMGNEFSFLNGSDNTTTFDYYREILNTAYADDINLAVFISPCHVTLWETLAVADLWNRWEEWKRLMVIINEEEAENAGKAPFPIWDFSTYNDITMEVIPSLDGDETEMEWYWDPSHYKKELGDLVLNRIYNVTTDGVVLPDNFGVLLTSENIERHLAQIREDRESYCNTHPDEVAINQAIMDELSTH